MSEPTQNKPYLPFYTPRRFSTRQPREPPVINMGVRRKEGIEAATATISRKSIPQHNPVSHHPVDGARQMHHWNQPLSNTAAKKPALQIPRKPEPQKKETEQRMTQNDLKGPKLTDGGAFQRSEKGCCMMM